MPQGAVDRVGITMNIYKVEVIADNSGEWTGNQLTFDSIGRAREYAEDLAWRWTLVRKWRVVDYLMRQVDSGNGY